MRSLSYMEVTGRSANYRCHGSTETLQPLVASRTRELSISPPGSPIQSTATAIRALAVRRAALRPPAITATMKESRDRHPPKHATPRFSTALSRTTHDAVTLRKESQPYLMAALYISSWRYEISFGNTAASIASLLQPSVFSRPLKSRSLSPQTLSELALMPQITPIPAAMKRFDAWLRNTCRLEWRYTSFHDQGTPSRPLTRCFSL